MNFRNALAMTTLNLVAVFTVVSFASLEIGNIYADAICPNNTYRIAGKGCFYNDTDNSILFTDYNGNSLEKTKKNDDTPNWEFVITKRDYEILNELLVIKSEINKLRA